MSMTAVKFPAGSLANTPFSGTTAAVKTEQGSKWTIGDPLILRKHAPPGEPISHAQMFISSCGSGSAGRLIGVKRADARREEASSNQSAHGHSEGGQK
jgi:hypothetical protein